MIKADGPADSARSEEPLVVTPQTIYIYIYYLSFSLSIYIYIYTHIRTYV